MATARKLTLNDLWTFPTLSNVALSPDGRRVAIVVATADKEKNETSSAISLLYLDEHGHVVGEPRRLTNGIKHDSSPVWAPDSRRLLFLSDREGDKNQLWLIDIDGGEAFQLTSMLHGVSEAAWSPDGQQIAFTAPSLLNDDDDVLTSRKTLDEAAKKRYEDNERFRLRTINTIFYRMDGEGIFEKFTQLFVMPAPSASATAVDPTTIRRLTTGDYFHSQPAWTPDGEEIGVLCNRNGQHHTTGYFMQVLWAISPETGEARCLTDDTLTIGCYSWSPDGRSAILVCEKDEIVFGSNLARLYLVTRRGNEGDRVLLLTPDLDNATTVWVRGSFSLPGPYRPQWSRDGQQIYFLVSENGYCNVYVMEVVWRTTTRLTSESITSYLALLLGDAGLLVAQGGADTPCELHRLPLPGSKNETPERLTHFYDALHDEFAWGKTERLRYKGANGDEVEGWLVHPIGAKEGVRYPLIVGIHGGPHWAFSAGIDPYFHCFAAQGYAIFYCNPHGSTSYGEEFMRSVLGDWGGKDYQDIMLGVDECIARGVADPERLVVNGYSYGGYMSMFIIGHTNRFKAAVPMAGISNLVSFVGTSDIGFWQVIQAKGHPWNLERTDYYRERSPINSAANVTTPTLFIHPENDLRCPIEQSEQFYMTLKMMGKVPVEFVRAPVSRHGGTAKLSQWFAYWEKMLEWFGKYIEIRPDDYS